MKYINKKILLILLIALIMFSFMISKKEVKQVVLDDVKVISNNKFAIQYQINGEYEKIDKFLGKEDGYFLNTTLSKCQDKDGKIIDNNLEYDNNKKTIVMETTSSAYCYLYFDEEENISNLCKDSNLSDCITNIHDKLETIDNLNGNQAGMYRYQGSNDVVTNNYICFGTSDKNECLQNEDKYMYRIIGITDDGKIKVIKKTALNDTGIQWHSLYQSTWEANIENNKKIVDANVPWSESDLFKRLNGLSNNNDNLFIGNDTYDYLKVDSDWNQKILSIDWLSGTLFWDINYFEPETIYQVDLGNYGVSYFEEVSPYYYNGGNTNEVLNTEEYKARRLKDGVICKKNNDTFSCYKTLTEQKFDDRVTAKIGLMSITDVEFAAQKYGKNFFYEALWRDEELIETYVNNWIRLINNDITVSEDSKLEWIIERSGYHVASGVFSSIFLGESNGIGVSWVVSSFSVRPVFYLNNTITLKSGNGSINNPYIIQK